MRAPLLALGLATAVLAGPLTAQTGPGDAPTAWVASSHGFSVHPSAVPQASGHNRLKGALWGGGIGLVAGGILGGVSAQSDDDGPGSSLVESAATGTAVALGALVGAGVGALLGATVFAPSRPLPAGAPDGMAVLVAPRRDAGGGLTIGLRLRR